MRKLIQKRKERNLNIQRIKKPLYFHHNSLYALWSDIGDGSHKWKQTNQQKSAWFDSVQSKVPMEKLDQSGNDWIAPPSGESVSYCELWHFFYFTHMNIKHMNEIKKTREKEMCEGFVGTEWLMWRSHNKIHNEKCDKIWVSNYSLKIRTNKLIYSKIKNKNLWLVATIKN